MWYLQMNTLAYNQNDCFAFFFETWIQAAIQVLLL